MKRQIVSDFWTEKTPSQCENCGKFYSNGSCMIFGKNYDVINAKLCKKCFDKLSKIEDEALINTNKTKHLNSLNNSNK